MFIQNIRYSIKALRKAPVMTVTATVALALGIGANTALFTVINAVLLKPLPYSHPERIVELMRHYPGIDIWATTPAKFAFWQRENHSFEAVAAYNFFTVGLNLVGSGEPQRLTAQAVSADYFRVLGASPFLGRTYTAQEDKPGAGHYAVLSHALWRKHFDSDSDVLGKNLSLSSANYEVIGVMPAGFDTPQHPDLWVPLHLSIDPADRSNAFAVIARLKPGVSIKLAEEDLKLAAQRFRKAYGSELIDTQESVSVFRYHDYLVGDAKRPLSILLAAVGFVLLVACANVANLLLARSAVRQREIAVRVAVGASGSQIVGQLLVESLMMSLVGAVCGCILAQAFLPLLLHLAPTNIPQLAGATIDATVLFYTLFVALLTGVSFGLFPAIQSARSGMAGPLSEAGTRTTGHAASKRVRQALVITEVAVSLLMLIGASLLIKTIGNLDTVQLGFDPRHVLVMQMSVDNRFRDPSALAQLNTKVATRLRSIPGVVSAASTAVPPFAISPDLPFEVVGGPASRDTLNERYSFVSPHYFSTLRVPLLAGRDFSEQDTSQSSPVLTVNQAFAGKYFPRKNPLGQQILIGRMMGPNFADKPRRIIGIVGDARNEGLNRAAAPEMYEPASQVPRNLLEFDLSLMPLSWVIRTTRDPMPLVEQIRREALTVAGDMPMAEPRSLDSLLSDSMARHRFVMTLLSIFASITLLLGTVGIYGVISYSVAQRMREMGIRSALGAHRSDLLALVVGEGMRLAGLGLGIGLLAAFGLTRFLESMLYGVSRSDPQVLAGMTAAMTVTAFMACFVPAYRASRVDPLVALHEE